MRQFAKNIPVVPPQSSSFPRCALETDNGSAATGQGGIILAIVLILLGIITALVLQAQLLARSGLNLEKNRLRYTQLRETAGDSVWQALNVLAADQDMLSDHTNEEWATPRHVQLPDGVDTDTVIIDENRFIDANMLAFASPSLPPRAPAAVIRDLLAAQNFPGPDTQAQIIRDWVDRDSDGSYEAEYYRRLARSVQVPNALMESREELLWLLGMTTNAGANVTILPGPGPRLEPVNVNTADRATLLAVFGADNAGLVEKIIRLRNIRPLLTLDQVVDPVTLQKSAAYLSVRSSLYSVYARAKTGDLAEEIYCLAGRDPAGNIKVLRWIER